MTGTQFKQLQSALLSAFGDHSQLEQLARVHLEQNLDEIAGGETLAAIVFNLVRWAESNAQIGALVVAALAEAPGNPDVRAVAASLLAQIDTRRTRPATVADTASLEEQIEHMARALREEIKGLERRLSDRMGDVEKRLDTSQMALRAEVAASYHPALKSNHAGQWALGFWLFVGCILFLLSDFHRWSGMTPQAALLVSLPLFALSGYLLFSGLGFDWWKK